MTNEVGSVKELQENIADLGDGLLIFYAQITAATAQCDLDSL